MCSVLSQFLSFTGGVPSVPVFLPPEGNVLRWETIDSNGADIEQLIITFERYLHALPASAILVSDYFLIYF